MTTATNLDTFITPSGSRFQLATDEKTGLCFYVSDSTPITTAQYTEADPRYSLEFVPIHQLRAHLQWATAHTSTEDSEELEAEISYCENGACRLTWRPRKSA